MVKSFLAAFFTTYSLGFCLMVLIIGYNARSPKLSPGKSLRTAGLGFFHWADTPSSSKPTVYYPVGTLSLSLLQSFYRWTWVSRYQNVTILDFMGVKDDGLGGDNWSYTMCSHTVTINKPTPNFFYVSDALLVAQPRAL